MSKEKQIIIPYSEYLELEKLKEDKKNNITPEGVVLELLKVCQSHHVDIYNAIRLSHKFHFLSNSPGHLRIERK